MNRVSKLILATSIFCTVGGLLLFVDRWPSLRRTTVLPIGKVEPYLSGELFLAPDGSVWKMKVDSTGPKTSLHFDPFLPGDDWMRVHGTVQSGMGIRQDGSLWTWGFRYDESRGVVHEAPHRVGIQSDWSEVQLADSMAVLLKRDGSIWFSTDLHEISVYQVTSSETGNKPTRLWRTWTWKDIAVTENGALYAIRTDDTLWTWGTMHLGYDRDPKLLGPVSEWRKLSGGHLDLIAQKKDGSLWIPSPAVYSHSDSAHRGPSGLERISEDLDWVKVSTGTFSFAAQKRDGSWWVRGSNRYSNLGFRNPSPTFDSTAQFTRFAKQLDPWAWDFQIGTTIILLRDGSFHYIGARPDAPPRTGFVTSAKDTVNELVISFTSKPRPFDDHKDDWSATPVKIGELPPSVLSSLRAAEPIGQR